MSLHAGQEFELAWMSTGLSEEHYDAFGKGWMASAAILTELLLKENERILAGLRNK